MRVEELKAYEVIERRNLSDIKSEGILMRHKKTGARVVLLPNEDDNKVFYIGFRTPPKDSTGVAHILEHSVLCGSDKFPIKDPFVELVKGSLNTFLNAMTYPDKTVYPVASCNDKDFRNLMEVYLDAVFYPNIYKTGMIFAQEGWHYELENADEPLSINGVVYNEMKGAFSSPDDVLERELMNSLYPETSYGVESGGDPEVIPELTYEAFLDFHRQYYHPSNSYIYLYGNVDMAEALTFIDEEYLSSFDKISVDSEIATQGTFTGVNRVEKEYPINEEESGESQGYFSLNMSVADSLDKELYVAFQVLDYALCSAPGAPLKEALIKKNIGSDVYSIYENGIKQPYFSIVAKDTRLEDEGVFLQTIEDTLTDLVKNGINEKALLAGINYFEFKYREADFGSYPKGLMYGLQALDSWLYDDSAPFSHIQALDTFELLKKRVKEGYFEELIQKYLLDNPHKSIVVLKPRKGLAEIREQELTEKLAKLKDSMTPEEVEKTIENTKALREYQDAEESEEDLKKIPLLSREDIGKKARSLVFEEKQIGDVKALLHEMYSGGIGYIRMMFSVKDLPMELIPYLGLFKGCLGLLNTKNYSYGELFNEINIQTGGMSAVNNAYANVDNPDDFVLTLELKTKVLYENIAKALELMQEVILTSDFTDATRMREIILEGKSRMQGQMISGGHSVAVNRAMSYGSASGEISEQISGIPFYRLICSLAEQFDAKELADKMNTLANFIFRKENLMVDFIGTTEGYEELAKHVPAFADSLFKEAVVKQADNIEVSRKNEGFMTSGQVQYVCRAGNFRKKGLPYTGALRILKVMLGYEYLWMNVRVKGGAYGCMCGFAKSGDSYFVSYRDPNLDKTVQVFEDAAKAVANAKTDERTLTQYLIGAISDLDVPMNPAALGLFSLSAYMTGVTQEMLQKERDDMLSASPEDIRDLSKYIEAFMEDDYFCCVGSAQKIKAKKDMFMHIENLT